jgi:hypothetical protein
MNDQLNANEEDEAVTRPHDRSALSELQTFNPRIRIIGVAAATVPSALHGKLPDHLNWEDNDVTTVATDSAEIPSAVSVRAIMDVGTAIDEVAEDEEEEEEPPATQPPVSKLPLSGLDWDDRENLTAPMPEEPSPLKWEDDEVTMPRRNEELRAQARALAASNEARRLAAERGRTGPHGTLVDASLSEDEQAQAKALVGRADTVVDAEPPSELTLGCDTEEGSPKTQPSTPPPLMAPPSIEIDLADLNASLPELASLLDADDDEHTPVPRAHRTPSTSPAEVSRATPGESFPPVEVADSTPFTRPSVTPRRGRGGLYAFSAVLALCLGVLAFALYPKTGALAVRLSTAEGNAVAKAEIFVDGKKRCDTDPCILSDIEPGSHVVKVVVPGHEAPVEATVEVKADERARLTIPLPALMPEEPAPAPKADAEETPSQRGVNVEVVTDGARVVLVQGQKTRVLSGPWPRAIELEPGRYKVVASRHGFEPFVQKITLAEGDALQQVRIELEPSTSSEPAADAAPAKTSAPVLPVAPAAPAAVEPDSDGDIYED